MTLRSRIIFSIYDDLKNPYYAGGGIRAVHEVARRLAAHHAVTVITGAYPGCTDEVINGVRYERVGFRWFGPWIGQLWFMITLSFRAWARRDVFDVWIESFGPPCSASGIPLVVKKPVIGLVHMLAGEDMWRKYRLPSFIVEHVLMRRYRNFIVPTEIVKEKILRLRPDAEVVVIPNGVESAGVPATRSTATDFVYLGRIEIDQKGLDLLLDAFERSLPRHAARLVIAGQGRPSEERRLRRLLARFPEDRVVWVGMADEKHKAQLLRNARSLVLPSRFETFGMVALEAMAYGVTPIAFDIEGLSWVPGSASVKVPAFDVDAMADTFVAISENTTRCDVMAQAGQEFAAHYDWNVLARAYRTHIDRIVGSLTEFVSGEQSPFVTDIIWNKRPCIFISPHLDDAVLSAGGLITHLAKHTSVKIITVFTEGGSSAPTISARMFLRQCGYRDTSTFFTDRRIEDESVVRSMGAESSHLGFSDALWRRRSTSGKIRRWLGQFLPELTYRYPTYRLHAVSGHIVSDDVDMIANIACKLRDVVAEHENPVVFAPVGIGNHVDHTIVHTICRNLSDDVVFWADFPYAARGRYHVPAQNPILAFLWDSSIEKKRKLILGYKTQARVMFGPQVNIPALPETYYIDRAA